MVFKFHKRNEENKMKINILKDFLNLKRNFKIVKGSPYAALKFNYFIGKCIVICIIALICYNLIKIILLYNGGSGIMTLIGRAFMFFLLVFICIKSWSALKPFKDRLSEYEKNQEFQKYVNTDSKKDIDDILENFKKKSNENKNKK